MKFDYASDLHLEINGHREDVEWGGDVLILAGDTVPVAYLQEHRTDKDAKRTQKAVQLFKEKVCSKYRYVIDVMGNHSHYHWSFPHTKGSLEKVFADIPNYILLEKQDFVIDDKYHIIGGTLWTDFNKGDPLAMMCAQRGMNDFYVVYQDPFSRTEFRPQNAYMDHVECLEWFRKRLREYEQHNYKTIVVTHHAPSYASCNPAHHGNDLDHAYASDLAWFIEEKPQINYWVHGHTHFRKCYKIGETNVVSNQCGYKGEKSYFEFTPKICFDL